MGNRRIRRLGTSIKGEGMNIRKLQNACFITTILMLFFGVHTILKTPNTITSVLFSILICTTALYSIISQL